MDAERQLHQQSEQRIAVGDEGSDIKLYRLVNGQDNEFNRTLYAAPVHSIRKPVAMAFDATGDWLAILRTNSVERRDLRPVLARVWPPFAYLWPPRIIYELPTVERGQLAFSPQGDLLAIGTAQGWQWRSSQHLSLVMEQPEQPITAITFSDDGCYIAFGEKSGTIQVWERPP